MQVFETSGLIRHMHTTQGPAWLSWAIPLLIVAVVGLRLRRMSRMQPLKLERLWVVPAIYAAFAAMTMWNMPPHAADLPWLALALIVGAAVGWQRGRLMRIHIDPETHALNQQGSPAAILFLLALVIVRMGMRQAIGYEAHDRHLSPAFITDIFILFALGLFAATRAEMFLRARRMLGALRKGP